MTRVPVLRIVPATEPLPSDDVRDVFRAYSRYVASIALRLLGRDDDVDDVVQEVFVVAIRGLRTLREPRAVRGWLAKITVRIARRRLRARRLRAFVGLDAAPSYAQLVVGAPQELALAIVRAYRVLDRLPVDIRIAWTLRYVEGESLEDVAAMCGCSLATAKRRIARARAELDVEVGR
jgi:RNA polymerase sigma-70 factor (ECF subfamily)